MPHDLPQPGILLSPQEEEQCRRYGQTQVALQAVEAVLLPAILAALTLTGAARGVLDWAEAQPVPREAAHLGFLLALGAAGRLLQLPFHWLEEHWIERRYGLSRESFGAWLRYWLARSTVQGGALLLLLWPVVESLRWPWTVPLWSLAYLPLRNLFLTHVQGRLHAWFHPVRYLRDERFFLPGLGRKTLPLFEVRVSHRTRRATAMIRMTGRDAALYATDTLLEALTPEEERAIVAHEFGHYYDRHHLEERTHAGIRQAARKMLLGLFQLGSGVAALGITALMGPWVGLRALHDPAGFPLLAGITLLLAGFFTPLLCAEARRDELEADQAAVRLTGDLPTFLSAVRKLRALNLDPLHAEPLGRLFDTHPSWLERARLLAPPRRRPARRRLSWRGWRQVQRHGRR